jgi:acetyltransferase
MPLLRPAGAGRFRPDAMFHPHSLAVIGAGTPAGGQVMANLLAGGFEGAILPVAAGVGAVRGVFAWPSVADLPIAPDLAILCEDGPAAATLAALAARGTHAAVAVGMAEGLAGAAAATGVRVLGPGSFGVAAPGIGLNATRGHLAPLPGRIALVSQSASLTRAVLDWAEPNGVGFSHIVGIGGNVDVGFGIVLDWLSRDAATGAILLDVLRIKDRRAFLSAARAAARLRPMVAMRAGGRLLDPSGDADAALGAALRRCGVLMVPGLPDLLAAAETLTRARPVRGEALAIVTNATGGGRLAADAALRDGLQLARLGEETCGALARRHPRALADGAIVRIAPDAAGDLAEVATLLGGAREVGGVLVVHAPAGAADAAAIAAIAAASPTMKTPLLVAAMGETTGEPHRRTLAAAGVAVFPSPEQAVRGFLHLVQDRRNRAAARELPPRAVLAIAPNQDAVRRAFREARAAGASMLTQDAAMAVLAAYGIPVVPSRPAGTADAAVDAARALGFPAVLKRRRAGRPDPASRNDLALDLRDGAQVHAAAALMLERSGDEAGRGLLVQRQIGRARELLVRLSDDAEFGPIIGFGQGGTAAELMRDVALDLPPLNLPLAHALIARARVAATLGPLRDHPPANEEALADTLVRVSQLVVDFPEIAELTINPLFADADVLAADAWIRLRGAAEPPGRLAIPPYPAELAGRYEANGQSFTIRPIRPEDAAAHGEMFRRLTPDDIRFRFFSSLREMSAEQVARLTQIDYEREMAFIAVADTTGETVGVARLVRDMHGAEAEFAVVVQPDMKGRGIGRHLMERLIAWGRGEGIGEIVGQVLADNQPMLGFARRLGFSLHRKKGEEDVVEARLRLQPRHAEVTN